ncbi:MAG: undecaprenyldiphospho-muramoylpentapeptide beta-N-acetylglucosaminyltransferase [Defluviitaleaceae bacterium]|nr:undecaprenyldiphospho-muramoylpentapeptide beta-N-acetylglucosaminyltransferase [Defluviitaleaceae bacterium]MCL2262404.1 undecaprenyldiphospho-muramoylpentapeptide beta-N-acetylglucosaminyltransferase [Defluviitaleaceae bacterium]
MKKIILTGGGTAGHVIPNLALLPALKAANFEVHYIGSHEGIERGLVESAGLPYYSISSGKLRRYFDVKNFTDIFRVAKGLGDAMKIIRKIKPDIIFSKGGFVVVPVITAARLCGVRCVIHESDISPGLANRLVMPFASKICVSFPETLKFLPSGDKAVLTGTPIRQALAGGDRLYGLKSAGFELGGKPVLLVTGGSQGAAAINACVREALPALLEKFRVIHLCGKGHLSGINSAGYVEFEYLTDTMPDILAAADIVISRAGANTIFELLALKKPHLLIPLPKGKSRGDQIQNADSFKNQGFSAVLHEEKMTPQTLTSEILALYSSRQNFTDTMSNHQLTDGIAGIMDVILKTP